jgi:20S proteasome alpha/beta subunit
MVGAVDDIILCANAGTAGDTRRARAKIRNQIIFVIPPVRAL